MAVNTMECELFFAVCFLSLAKSINNKIGGCVCVRVRSVAGCNMNNNNIPVQAKVIGLGDADCVQYYCGKSGKTS